MGKIQLLNEAVSSRIAAGEVVERPASVVKELLENAIDAHASSIVISIADGGVREIRVTDNGEGISHEDMSLSIVKHATSKIFTLEDLEHINSMGFRGEALASIAAVSMMTIKSRTKDSEFGSELYAKGGKLEYIRKAGLADGTTVIVENLFYNTPARLKFLKKPGAEAALISDMIARLILANPHISFRYTISGKVVYHSPGNGSLEDAIYSVYGFDMKSALIPIDFQFNQLYLKGFIGVPSKAFKTQKYGTLLVNGRYVRNAFVQKIVMRAYGERMLKGNFPFYVLNLTLPAEDIDVNVHPNKLAIHFRDENELEYVILNALEEALRKSQRPPELTLKPENVKEELQPVAPVDFRVPKPKESILTDEERSRRIDEILQIASDTQERRKKPLTMREAPAYAVDQKSLEDFDLSLQTIREQKEGKKQEKLISMENIFSKRVDFKILGAAFDAYIIIECKDSLYLIDQHAAHERKIYDTLLRNITEHPISQTLLAPIRVEITPSEKFLLQENLDIIQGMGFVFRTIQDLYCDIIAYPQVLGEVNIRQAMQDMIASLEEGDTSFNIRKDKIAKGACKRAIKAGMKMAEADIRELVERILNTDSIPHCPHGRPVAIALSKAELEDSFKRRV